MGEINNLIDIKLDLELINSNFDYNLLEKYADNSGQWKCYSRWVDGETIYNDLKDKGVEWEVAQSLDNANWVLTNGNQFVYYIKDEEGNYTIPKALIGFISGKIYEYRGTNLYQALDKEYIKPTLDKVKELENNGKNWIRGCYQDGTIFGHFELATIGKLSDELLTKDQYEKILYRDIRGYSYYNPGYTSIAIKERKEDINQYYKELLLKRNILKDFYEYDKLGYNLHDVAYKLQKIIGFEQHPELDAFEVLKKYELIKK